MPTEGLGEGQAGPGADAMLAEEEMNCLLGMISRYGSGRPPHPAIVAELRAYARGQVAAALRASEAALAEATKERDDWKAEWYMENKRAEEQELVINATIACRCLKHAAIPATILPPAAQECGLCMREEGILVGRMQRPERPIGGCPHCGNVGCVCTHAWGESCRCVADPNSLEAAHAEATKAERRDRQLLLALVCSIGRGVPLHLSNLALHAHGGPNPGRVETLVEPNTDSIALIAVCDHAAIRAHRQPEPAQRLTGPIDRPEYAIPDSRIPNAPPSEEPRPMQFADGCCDTHTLTAGCKFR